MPIRTMFSFALSMICHLGSSNVILWSLNGLYTHELATLQMPWLYYGIKFLFVYMQFCVGCILVGLA